MLGPGRWLLGPSRNQAICPIIYNMNRSFVYSFENRITTAERGSCWQRRRGNAGVGNLDGKNSGREETIQLPPGWEAALCPRAGRGHQSVKSTNPLGSGRPVPRNRGGTRSGGAKGGCRGLCRGDPWGSQTALTSKLVALLPFLLTPLSTVSM